MHRAVVVSPVPSPQSPAIVLFFRPQPPKRIPRYVDRFEEEEIDLAAVAVQLRQCDRDMLETDRLIRRFCEELGIDAPF
jgi:hypothetical protein